MHVFQVGQGTKYNAFVDEYRMKKCSRIVFNGSRKDFNRCDKMDCGKIGNESEGDKRIICRSCGGLYCKYHKDPVIHDCRRMGRIIEKEGRTKGQSQFLTVMSEGYPKVQLWEDPCW